MKTPVKVIAYHKLTPKGPKWTYTAIFDDESQEVIRKSNTGFYALAHYYPTRHKRWNFGNANSRPLRCCTGPLFSRKGRLKWNYEDFPGQKTFQVETF